MIEEKCIVDEKTPYLPGFCNDDLEYDRWDIFNLDYGKCYIVESESIPSHKQFFYNLTLGDLGVSDCCPSIHKSNSNFSHLAVSIINQKERIKAQILDVLQSLCSSEKVPVTILIK